MTDEVAREAEQRLAIIAAARSWINTPFHDHSRIKGVGCDCAQLLCAVYHEAGLIPHVETGHYSPQHFLHHPEERLAESVSRYASEIDEARVGPGDVVLYKIYKCYAHAAIIVDWPREVIHAHKQSGKVIAMPAFSADMQVYRDGRMRGRETRFFSIWG